METFKSSFTNYKNRVYACCDTIYIDYIFCRLKIAMRHQRSRLHRTLTIGVNQVQDDLH